MQAGVVYGDVNLRTGAPVRTRYRQQLRRIAPERLIGREQELAELASELTGVSDYEVHDHLRTVTGRTFTRRASHYRPEIGPEAYLLGHEDVQAVRLFGLWLPLKTVAQVRPDAVVALIEELGTALRA